MNNIDRILGVISMLSVLVVAVMTIMSFSWISLLLVLVLGIWVLGGLKSIEIGWKGQLLSLGERMDALFEEGWRWIPFPFGLKNADCRKQTISLGKLETTTKDNVKVFVDGSVVYQVEDLQKYFNATKSDLEKWIDDTRKQVVRTRIRELEQKEALNMHDDLGKEMEEALLDQGSEPTPALSLTRRGGIYGIAGNVTVPASGSIPVILRVSNTTPIINQTPIMMVNPTTPQNIWLFPVVFFSSLAPFAINSNTPKRKYASAKAKRKRISGFIMNVLTFVINSFRFVLGAA
ncbi:hypothetical protein A3H53_01005 [Candidatus Nomurabacteria bacterium RIFCSPLOWO2_02_FULL_40_10]|uniref:Band 7 domain-containing protein n=1 Tax=Candidatus Nomurabacteria bacterium RIFCSPLOWO2_02_FULL_40_10 TaxID=1801786 RepID=A0A1F6Y075_9BACT|nr:MAG: hypothetical protein A3H53_01005 [Candidatus Nomurabacteria bacterium RIFCSPLOWO2_02_FULL_40_10]